MLISEAIVHGITKEANNRAVDTKHAIETLVVDEKLQNLGAGVLGAYGKSTNNYGTFDNDRETYRFAAFLEEYAHGGNDLIDFTTRTSNLIAREMGDALLATGGYALFLRYTSQGRNWMMVAMLKIKAATGIDFNTLKLTEAVSFDMGHLHEAARIDLDKWQNGEQPYLSFVKRSGRQDEVTRYFRTALGCTEYTDAKSNTQQMLNAMNDFCEARGFDPERKNGIRQATYDYCEEKCRNNEPVNLTALSARLFDQEPAAFADFVKENDKYSVSETFSPHPATYKRLRKLSGRTGNVSVSFEVDDLLRRRVAYDANSNSLIIHNISEKLKQEILQVQGNAAEE